jgi:hypothetical protein
LSGQLSITPTAAFLAADGNSVAMTPVVAFVANGFLNVTLEPNDTGVPASTRYVVVYSLKGGGQYTEIWNVTGSGTKRVSDVRVATSIIPSYVVQPSQIGQAGAMTNQVLGWTGLTWGPVAPGGAGAVSSVFGRTGVVVPANGDYAYGQLSGVPSTFAPSAHAAAHKNGGTDEVATATPATNSIPKTGGLSTLALGWIPIIPETQISFTDVTTGNVSLSAHGFVAKLPNDATKYYDGTGAWSVPAGGGGGLSGGTTNRFSYWTSATTLGSHQYLTNGLVGQTYTPESPVLQNSGGCALYMATTGSGPSTSRLVYDCKLASAALQDFQLIDSGGNVVLFSSIGTGWTVSGLVVPVTIVEDIFIPAAFHNTATAVSAWGPWEIDSTATAPLLEPTGGTQNAGAIAIYNTGTPTLYHRRVLPSTWTGAIDVAVWWADECCGSGNVKWTAALGCGAAGSGVYGLTGSNAPFVFNTASNVTTASAGAGAQPFRSAMTSLSATNCAAGAEIALKITRDNTVTGNVAGRVKMLYVMLTIRRTNS